MRIAILAKADNAGSGQRFASALRSTGHSATLCTWERNPYGFPIDMLATLGDNAPVQQLIDAADVVHLKGDHLPSEYEGLYLGHKPVVITPGGSRFRRRTGTAAQPWEQERHPLEEYKRQADAIGVLTPDLMYPEVDPTWTPHATEICNAWKEPSGTVVIGHSPSNPQVKGTDSVVIPAINMLQDSGHAVELKLITGMNNLQCLAEKAKCHLFIDQCIIPAYGLSGVEAMSMGIPLIQRLPPAALRPHPYLSFGCPVISFPEPIAQSLYTAVHRALSGDLRQLHRRTLNYCKAVHGFKAVAVNLMQLYTRAIQVKRRRTLLRSLK